MLSPAEAAFVSALIDCGDEGAAAEIAGCKPSVAYLPHVQLAISEALRDRGAVDAAFARRILYDLARNAELDSVRMHAAETLWTRGLGKVPDQIHIRHEITALSRDQLYGEIRQLITDLGLPSPETIEGAYTEIAPEASIAQDGQERPEPATAGREVAGSSPAAGTYTPELPPKWR